MLLLIFDALIITHFYRPAYSPTIFLPRHDSRDVAIFGMTSCHASRDDDFFDYFRGQEMSAKDLAAAMRPCRGDAMLVGRWGDRYARQMRKYISASISMSAAKMLEDARACQREATSNMAAQAEH